MCENIDENTFIPIKGYEGIYEINKNGEIRNIKTKYTKKNYISKVGYYVVDLYKNKQKTTYYIHRLLAIHFIPNNENKPQINHKDGNKLNNCLNNLEWVTCKENLQHAFKTGLNKGKPNLPESIIIDLFLNRFLRGESITTIANNSSLNIKLSALSVQFKKIAKKLNKEKEYIKELKRQKYERAKLKGLKTRKRRILFVYDKNYKLIGIFNSITQAAKTLNIRSGGISNVLSYRVKTVGGYYIKQLPKPNKYISLQLLLKRRKNDI